MESNSILFNIPCTTNPRTTNPNITLALTIRTPPFTLQILFCRGDGSLPNKLVPGPIGLADGTFLCFLHSEEVADAHVV